jgi:serine/threonine protein kinase
MSFLNPEVFAEKYPLLQEVGSGTYAKVYSSSPDVVVKIHSFEYNSEELLQATLVEIDVYSWFSHPCLPKLFGWTADSSGTRMALSRGSDIVRALQDKKISLREVAGDLLSILVFFHENRMFHGDIKDHNVIFLNGRAALIDFGLAGRSARYSDGDAVFGDRYSWGLRDPEYSDTYPNPISTELYGLGTTLNVLAQRVQGLTPDYTRLRLTGDSMMNTLIELCRSRPVRDRISAHRLLEEFPELRRSTGEVIGVPSVPKPLGTRNVQIRKVLKLAQPERISAETLFLTGHLLHRLSGFESNSPLALVCLFLALTFRERATFPFEIISKITGTPQEEISKSIIRAAVHLGGIIDSSTSWDYAQSVQDLPLFFEDLCSDDYNLEMLPYSNLPQSDPKDISVQELLLVCQTQEKEHVERKIGQLYPIGRPIPMRPEN